MELFRFPITQERVDSLLRITTSSPAQQFYQRSRLEGRLPEMVRREVHLNFETVGYLIDADQKGVFRRGDRISYRR